MARNQSRAEAGFTLLEALVAAAVLAIISLMMAPALVGALDAASRNHAMTDRIEDRAALDGVMHELFARTHQLPLADQMLQFSGGPTAASFMVRPDGAGVHRAELRLVEDRLTLSMAPVALGPNGEVVPATDVVLAEGFEAGQLSYVGLDRTRWRRVDRERWSGERPPRLVILQLDWPDGTKTRIQSLVAGEGRFDCRFDSGRGLCLGDSY